MPDAPPIAAESVSPAYFLACGFFDGFGVGDSGVLVDPSSLMTTPSGFSGVTSVSDRLSESTRPMP